MILNEKDKFRSIMIRSITIIFIINTILLCLYFSTIFLQCQYIANKVAKLSNYLPYMRIYFINLQQSSNLY